MVFLVIYAIYYLDQHAENQHFFPQVHEHPHHHFLHLLLGVSSLKSHIHSSMLYAAAGAWVALVIPWGHAGSLPLVLFSTTAFAIAWQPSCTVFKVTSTCTTLPAQLTGSVKLNLTSLAFPKGSPSLSNHLPKNKFASPEARTTSSVIHSLRPCWNMSAINKPLNAWEGGGWSSPPPLRSL